MSTSQRLIKKETVPLDFQCFLGEVEEREFTVFSDGAALYLFSARSILKELDFETELKELMSPTRT